MDWARTLRIDSPPSEASQNRLAADLAATGVRVRFGAPSGIPRTYALIEGPEGTDPAQLEAVFDAGRWYGEAIIALAIEPEPADALPGLAAALGGPGAPAGVLACDSLGTRVVVDFAPSVTRASFVLRIADVELERFRGHRRVWSLSPLPQRLVAQIAAEGLQAPEIAADRILESLLDAARVE